MKQTNHRFGLSDDDWKTAKAELRDAIVDAARRQDFTHYGAVAARVTVTHLEPHSGLMNHLLGEIFEDECAANRPALTSIVTHRDGDREPGLGFYNQARTLGYRFDDPLEFWSTQVKAVFNEYGRPRRQSAAKA
jgi:hypothetical protein